MIVLIIPIKAAKIIELNHHLLVMIIQQDPLLLPLLIMTILLVLIIPLLMTIFIVHAVGAEVETDIALSKLTKAAKIRESNLFRLLLLIMIVLIIPFLVMIIMHAVAVAGREVEVTLDMRMRSVNPAFLLPLRHANKEEASQVLPILHQPRLFLMWRAQSGRQTQNQIFYQAWEQLLMVIRLSLMLIPLPLM